MKRFFAAALLFGAALVSLSAQASLTRFAVVDMNRVVSAFAGQSDSTKALAEKAERVQAEINRRSEELTELNNRLIEAQEQGRREQARTLENQIRTKTQDFQNYLNRSNAELARDQEQLLSSEAFVSQLRNIIRLVAESEGYTMVLNKDMAGILWYSPSVDITNRVVERIRSSTTRR